MKVTAKARRSGEWWAVEVPEVPGALTQAKRLDQVAEAAAGAVADLTEVDAGTIEVEIEVSLIPSIAALVRAAREAAADAAEAQAAASASMRAAVSELREVVALTTRDAALLLGISHQRVAQLEAGDQVAKKAPAKRVAPGKAGTVKALVADVRPAAPAKRSSTKGRYSSLPAAAKAPRRPSKGVAKRSAVKG